MKLRRLILVIVLVIFNCKEERLPFELREERRLRGGVPLDINDDKTDELSIATSYNMAVIDQKGNYLWDFYYSHLPETVKKTFSVVDFNHDGLKEIFLNYSESLWQVIECYNSKKNGDLINKFVTVKGEDRNRDGRWDGGVGAVGGIDANDDGSYDLLLFFSCGYDLQPRGLAVYDAKTGKEIWHYWIGQHLRENYILLEDLNSDEKPEIILGTYSPANRSVANDSPDTVSYLIVLDRKGKLVWRKRIGGVFIQTMVAISDIDGDRQKEIITASSSRGEIKMGESNRLLILDGETGDQEKFLLTGENFWGLVCADLTHDGKEEILTGNADGKVRVFNSDLDEVNNFQNNTGIEIIGVCDLDGDGRIEIITTTEDAKLIIFNEKLKKVAQLELKGSILHEGFGENIACAVKPIRYHKQKKLLITIPDGRGDKFVLYNFVPVSFPGGPNLLPIFLLIILLLLLGYLYVWQTIIPKIQFSPMDLLKKAKEGYIILSKKGKVLFTNDAAEKILGREKLDGIESKEAPPSWTQEILEKEEGEITIKGKEGERIISFQRNKIKKGFLLRIEDRTKEEHLKRVQDWAGVAQKLAHGVKNPLSTILGAIEQIEVECENVGIKKYVGYVKDEVTKLRKMADAFMRFTKMAPPVLVPKNINEVIKKIVGKYETSLLGKVVIKWELDENLPLINFDEEGIFNALNIIIENGVEAIMAKGKENRGEELGILKIRTLPTERLEKGGIKRYVRIEISDTGTGIPERYLEKVFDPYFTYNKPLGTGLGLTLAKKIIEDHKGYIEIHSREGVGTEVNVYLPLG